MSNAALADLHRWSEEVARDPASPAFLPLARAYRRQGRRDAAVRLCLRALERQPEHVEGHALLALLYLEAGDRQRACDEWAVVLTLDPDHFEAHRGMGYAALERGDLTAASRHLEKAAASRPDDPAVQGALRLLHERLAAADATVVDQGGAASVRDASSVFEPLLGDSSFLGALVLDTHGLVLAGTLAEGGTTRAEALGAVLGIAVGEAVRLGEHVGLGDWRGILLETTDATLHVAPLGGDLVVLVVAVPGAPAGWMLRVAARAEELARDYVEGGR